jgi:tRNA1(Val) A37 N6-methylase TrmN6
MVHSFAGAEASLVLVEGVKGGRSGMKILAPLVIFEKGKQYSAEVASMLAGAPQSVSSLISGVSR